MEKSTQKLKGSIEKAVCTGISARQTACKKLKKNSKRPNHLLQIVGNVVLRLIGRYPTSRHLSVRRSASVRRPLVTTMTCWGASWSRCLPTRLTSKTARRLFGDRNMSTQKSLP